MEGLPDRPSRGAPQALTALAGLRRLQSQGRFTEPKVCREALDGYRSECNPARSFLAEAYREDPGSHEGTDAVYQQYRDWCVRNGYQPLGERQFGKEVARAFPRSERGRRQVQGGRRYVYAGIRAAGATAGCAVPGPVPGPGGRLAAAGQAGC